MGYSLIHTVALASSNECNHNAKGARRRRVFTWSHHALRRRWPMNQPEEAALVDYPHGRGYGHDYMRGGEVLGGYGYAERDEYSKARGELNGVIAAQESDESQQETRT